MKYFDCITVNLSHSSLVNTWEDALISMTEKMDSVGVKTAYSDSSLIPSIIGSAYGESPELTYTLKKLHVRGVVQTSSFSQSVTVGTSRDVTVLLILDTQPNLGQGLGEDIMQSWTGGTPTNLAFKNVAQAGRRFVVLQRHFEKTYVQSTGDDTAVPAMSLTDGTGGQAAYSHTISESWSPIIFDFQWVPRSPFQVRLIENGTAGAADLVNANIFLLCQTGGHTTTFHCTSRCYFC